ncbi:MAG TPA: peptidoglycan-binding protein [Stellaceae bacterium]|nr:peptidoglycan-binding protein [Stellaceae bacterium]
MAMLYAGAAQAQSSYGTDQRYCDRSAISQVLSPTTGNILGSAAGGAVGGLLGSQIGKGSGNTAATIIGVLGGALGGGYIGRSMQPADQGCVTQSLDHAPTNQPVAWQNPSNGSSYWVTPTRDLRGPRGEPCREYVTDAVIDGRPQRTRNTACQQPDGNWVPLARNEVHVARPAAREGAYSAPAPISRDMVFRVQQRLRDLGFYVRDNIDGQWGPRTSVAVRNFQRAKGLDPSGQLNSATLTALNLR